MNNLNRFEKEIKKAASNYSVPYDQESAWQQMEAKLPSKSFPWVYGLMILGIVAVAAIYGWSQMQMNTDSSVQMTQVSPSVPDATPAKNAEKKEAEASITPSVIATNEGSPAVLETSSHTPSVQDENLPTVSSEEEVPVEELIPTAHSETESMSIKETPSSTTPIKKMHKALKIKVSSNKVCPKTSCVASYNMVDFEGKTIVWNLPNGQEKIGDSVEIDFEESGIFEITAHVQEDPSITSNMEEVMVYEQPNAQFVTTQNMVDAGIPVVAFEPVDTHHKLYKWYFGDGTQVTGKNASHVYMGSERYEAQLMVVSEAGCIWNSYQPVSPDGAFNLLAPTSFSPNSDGLNDTWFPKALQGEFFTFDLRVFDRQGYEVFTTSSAELSWDGKVNGKLAQPGEAFIWKCKTKDKWGVTQHFTGNIMVLY